MPQKRSKSREYEKLFEPIQIGSVKLKNRFAYAPTNLVFHSWDGLMNEQELAYYTARAMGGLGMVIYGAILSSKFGVPYMQHPWVFCFDVAHVPGLSNFAENIRLAGSMPFIQLLPVPSSGGRNWTGTQPVAPSAGMGKSPPYKGQPIQKLIQSRIPNSWSAHNVGGTSDNTEAREITLEEIQTVIKENTHACRLATLAGFAGIELHLCHGYMLSAFRDPRMNKRKDKYGGSEENRHRLLLEITDEAIRAAKQENPLMVVGVRVDTMCNDGGYGFDDTKRLALKLQDLGIDYYHVTFGPDPGKGSPEAGGGHRIDGVLLDYAKELKKILKVPVITPSVHNPKLAEKAIAEGWTDIVSNAHQFLADPQFVNKLKSGREKDIVKCTECGFCGARSPVGLNLPVRCAVNPEAGFERYNPEYQIRKGFTKADSLPYILRTK